VSNIFSSKHMDKHDRPYKCTAPGCEKLQGFTYSGGLLRHEREVHKMHGGTKKPLFCPHSDCKRSSGAGFTRRENLAEHIRRVHRTSTGSTDPSAAVIEAGGAVRAAEEASMLGPLHASPGPTDQNGTHHAYATLDTDLDPSLRDHTIPDARKRKRLSTGTELETDFDAFEVEDVRQEVKRLRQENEEKDERIRKLEDQLNRIMAHMNRYLPPHQETPNETV
jgi:hypothetical protein